MNRQRVLLTSIVLMLMVYCIPATNCKAKEVERVESELRAESNFGISTAAFSATCLGPDFGFTGWKDLGSAMAYYGSDYEYHYCGTYKGDARYNYYYTFSSGQRMYFGAHTSGMVEFDEY